MFDERLGRNCHDVVATDHRTRVDAIRQTYLNLS